MTVGAIRYVRPFSSNNLFIRACFTIMDVLNDLCLETFVTWGLVPFLIMARNEPILG